MASTMTTQHRVDLGSVHRAHLRSFVHGSASRSTGSTSSPIDTDGLAGDTVVTVSTRALLGIYAVNSVLHIGRPAMATPSLRALHVLVASLSAEARSHVGYLPREVRTSQSALP